MIFNYLNKKKREHEAKIKQIESSNTVKNDKKDLDPWGGPI